MKLVQTVKVALNDAPAEISTVQINDRYRTGTTMFTNTTTTNQYYQWHATQDTQNRVKGGGEKKPKQTRSPAVVRIADCTGCQ